MHKIKGKWKIIFDMCLNIGAAGAPIVILQLFVYPYMAKRIDTNIYGLMITMYSMWLVVSNSLGNVLNNIRLLREDECKEKELVGDFNLLLRIWAVGNLIVTGCFTIFYIKKLSFVDILFSIVIATLILFKSYYEVGFRIKLNYVAILINGILQSAGFLLGMFLFSFTGQWQFVYLFGFLFNTLFTIFKTGLYKEPAKKTTLYTSIKRDSNILAIATFSNSLMSYADKMVLYPLMGGHAVSVYYTATILGKIVSMVSGPITSVILSYISKWDKGKKSVFTKVFFIGGILAVVGYFLTLLISHPIISILFPQWVDEVMIYLPITTIAIVIQTLNSFLNPFVLKFYDIKWQIITNLVGVCVYFISALVLWEMFGLIGFCLGIILGRFSKTVIMVLLHFFNRKAEA